MKDLRPSTMLVWSIRDATRRPAETLLLAAVLFSLAAWMGTVLLLNHALESTAVSRWTTAHRDLWRRRVGIAFQTSRGLFNDRWHLAAGRLEKSA